MSADAATMAVGGALDGSGHAPDPVPSSDGEQVTRSADPVVSVFVVDDHAVLREGLRSVLERTGRIHVVGEAECVADAITRIRIVRPQVVVVDLQLPDGSGTELCAHVRDAHPDIGLLVLTSLLTDEALFSSIEAGADGFLLKDARIDRIVEAIETIARGGSWIDDAVAGRVLHKLREPISTKDDHLGLLSSSEREVLSHLATGRSNREIAARVCLSESAVKKHVTTMMRKIGVQSRTEAAVFALRAGIELPDQGS